MNPVGVLYFMNKGVEITRFMRLRYLFIFLSICTLMQAGEPTSGPEYPFDVQSYKMNIGLYHCFEVPYPNNFTASLVMKVKAVDPIASLALNAASFSLQIDSVGMAATAFAHSDNLLTLNLDRIYLPGEVLDISIYYRHLDVDDYAFIAGNGMVFTSCEPEGARNWFPCHDVPSDKATFEITAKTPAGVRLGSNGILADSTVLGDTVTYHWVSTDPLATYLAVVAASDNYLQRTLYWHKPSDPSDSIPILFYYHPGEDPGPVSDIILPLTDFYSEIFCEYPFQKGGFASMNELFYGGGMENQTLISLCYTCWRESLAAHEYAHMWFGDMITCATWADLWLNEGLATWTTAYWQEHNQGFASYKSFLINKYALPYIANNPGLSLSDSSYALRTPSFDTLFNTYVTYMKGACMVHQLRYVLGDTLFFRVLKDYVTDTNLRYKSATIGDLMHTVTKAAGKDYDWLFNDWVFRPNHPVYQNTYEILQNGSNSYTLQFQAKQIQASPSFFRMILPLKVLFADNSDTLVSVMNSTNGQLFSFTFPRQPIGLVFDPDTNIMLKEGTTSLGITDLPKKTEPFTLYQNVPNPSGSTTDIPYRLLFPAQVRLEVLDISGRTLLVPMETTRPEGRSVFTLDCSGLHAGTYFYRMTAGKYSQTRKMVILPERN
jgi:aminopeptidase N